LCSEKNFAPLPLKHLKLFRYSFFLGLAHFFGFYNPNELADFVGISRGKLYSSLKSFSLYMLKKILIKFMVKQAAEMLQPVLGKSSSTISRSGITLSVDDSVIDRLGRMLRCTYSWYSGRWKKVVQGNDLLGIVLTFEGIVIPLHLLFCSKQGRGCTDRPSLLISMLNDLKKEFEIYNIDISRFPISMDSWFVSEDLKRKLQAIGFRKIIIAGKGNYVFKIKSVKRKASLWKKTIELTSGQWAIEVPSCRVKGENRTFGKIVLFFFKKSRTRAYYLMDFSVNPMRGAEIWRVWKQHHLIEHFWKILKSVFQIKSMRLQGDGLYAGLLVKILSYLLAVRLKGQKRFSKLSIVQVMRTIRKENDLKELMNAHFHVMFSVS
jgi:hypothetical protein